MDNKIYNITTTLSSLINNEKNVVKFINTNVPVLSTVLEKINDKTTQLSTTIDNKFWTAQQTSAAIDNALTGKIDLTHYIKDDKNCIISGTITTTSGFYINEEKIQDITYTYIDNKFEDLKNEVDNLLKNM